MDDVLTSKVSYGGKRLIPAPLVNVTKDYQKTGDGTTIGKIYRLTLNGTIMAYKGSPRSWYTDTYDANPLNADPHWEGFFWIGPGYPDDESIAATARLAAIQRKIDAIRMLFSIDGLSFEIQSAGGQQPWKCNPRVISIDFAQGPWYDRCEYTITLETNELFPFETLDKMYNDDPTLKYISQASENWTFETNDALCYLAAPNKGWWPTYRLTHTVSANGFNRYDENGVLLNKGWEEARKFVVPKLGLDGIFIENSGVYNLKTPLLGDEQPPPGYTGYDYLRTQDANELDGSFSVTETWIVSRDKALETLDISQEYSYENGLNIVRVEGSIEGLEERIYDSTEPYQDEMQISVKKYTNAETKFNEVYAIAYTRAVEFTGLSTLNISPISTSIGRNPVNGVINYSLQFDDRPSNLISFALSENITLNDTLKGEAFASVFVLGRSKGPVLQDLGTTNSLVRNLSIEIVVARPTGTASNVLITQKPSCLTGDIAAVISAVDPNNLGYARVFKEPPQESWNPKEGRYSCTIQWTYHE